MILEQRRNSRKWPRRSSSPFFHRNESDGVWFRYEILSDPNSREVYDREGMDGLTGGRDGGMPADAADLFAHLFGGGTFFDLGGGGPSRRKGEDTEITYDVTLEDLYNGKSVKVNMEKEIICGTCNGLVYSSYFYFVLTNEVTIRSGARGSAKPKECNRCQAKGWIFTQTQVLLRLLPILSK